VEPAVRQRCLVLLSFCACLFLSQAATAITFQTRLEKIEWKVEGDQFECRLSQPITDFGTGEFVRRAGEQATFRLKPREHWMGAGAATLLAAAAPWQPGRGDINLGAVRVVDGEVPFNSTQEQAGRLITGLMEGRSPLVRHHTWQGGDALEVRLLPVRFTKAYDDYLACTAKLLPVNFEQIKKAQLGFPGGGYALDDLGRAKLDIIIEYVKADPSVNHFEIDGHSDNSGSRLTNRDLSRRRALAVEEYLKANGVPAEQIVVRFHGERYPLAPNTNEANRAKNRRAIITLSRVPQAPVVPEAPAETPPPAAPANAPIVPAATS
jgi:outer membrane protein OmpA-like peptidoglycan-associated protein